MQNLIRNNVYSYLKNVLPENKIRNIYLYGSRVYGTFTPSSDYDLVVVACSLYSDKELYTNDYNIHITTPDIFRDKLEKHDIHCLECLFSPDEAKILNSMDLFGGFKINNTKLRKMLLSQSHCSWVKAKRKIEHDDIIGGEKSLFHSLRILNFGLQILEKNIIYDFSNANYIWKEISDCNCCEWDDYFKKWSDIREKMSNELKCEVS